MAGTAVDGEIGAATIEGGTYAVGRFDLGDQEYPQAWFAVVGGWLPESGYQPDDRLCFERYLSDGSQHPGGRCAVEICVPVRPL